jgi:hypothetical protein
MAAGGRRSGADDFAALPPDVLSAVVVRLCSRDRLSLAATCRVMYRMSIDASASFWVVPRTDGGVRWDGWDCCSGGRWCPTLVAADRERRPAGWLRLDSLVWKLGIPETPLARSLRDSALLALESAVGPHVHTLTLTVGKLRALPDLRGFTRLVRLSVEGLQLERCADLPASLESLDVSYNDVPRLGGLQQLLSGLTRLTRLCATRCELESCSGLPATLQSLRVDQNRLGSLRGLGGLTQLTSLSVAKCGIETCEGVPESLKVVDVSDNDLSTLRHLSAVTHLELSSPLRLNVAELRHIPLLQACDVWCPGKSVAYLPHLRYNPCPGFSHPCVPHWKRETARPHDFPAGWIVELRRRRVATLVCPCACWPCFGWRHLWEGRPRPPRGLIQL